MAVNEKGTAAYSAITSKLGRVKLAGLTAAASLGLAAASPAATQAAALPGGEETTAVDTRDYDEGRPRITADKFCDQIVINIASADGQGLDEIREKDYGRSNGSDRWTGVTIIRGCGTVSMWPVCCWK